MAFSTQLLVLHTYLWPVCYCHLEQRWLDRLTWQGIFVIEQGLFTLGVGSSVWLLQGLVVVMCYLALLEGICKGCHRDVLVFTPACIPVLLQITPTYACPSGSCQRNI